MSGAYDPLREGLQGATKGMDHLFLGFATHQDGLTAAVVALAAVDITAERAAALLQRETDEIDAIVSLFNASVRRSIAREREARGDET